MTDKEEHLGIIGLTLGILSIVFLANNGIILGVIGLIFSLRQQKKNPTKLGRAGVITSIIGIICAIVFIIIMLVYLRPLLEQQMSQLGGLIPTQ